jgi:hypothetical protein
MSEYAYSYNSLAPAKVTPGEILEKEFLEPLNISQNELAKRSRKKGDRSDKPGN